MKTYNPKEVVVVVGGFQITGFADNALVKVNRNADAWAMTMGADGEGTRSKSNDKSGTIEISLMQSSPSNKVLSDLAIADELDGTGLVPAMVKDNSGKSLHAAEQAFVKKIAEADYSKQAGPRTWIIETDNLVHFIGGN